MKSQSEALASQVAKAGGKVMQRKEVDGIKVSHFRKGQKGGWKSHFTVAQSELYDKLSNQRLHDCEGLDFEM